MIACERTEVSVSCGTIIGLESSTYHMGTSCRAMLNRIRYMHNHPGDPKCIHLGPTVGSLLSFRKVKGLDDMTLGAIDHRPTQSDTSVTSCHDDTFSTLDTAVSRSASCT
jgi:hypothetical protein